MAGQMGRSECPYTMGELKKNYMRLLVAMCIGIALGLHGVYVQARSHSNPNYMSTLSMASNWLYTNLGQPIVHPAGLLRSMFGSTGCKEAKAAQCSSSVGCLLMSHLVSPTTRYSGILNGSINVLQIVLLIGFAGSCRTAGAILGLSAFGLIVSCLCLIGSFASCKMMCFSCLGLHHIAIIYLAHRRRHLLRKIQCPTEPGPNCIQRQQETGGGGPPPKDCGASLLKRSSLGESSKSKTGGASGSGSSSCSAPPAVAGAAAHSSSCNTRLRRPTDRRT